MRSHRKPKSGYHVLSQLNLSQALQGLHAEYAPHVFAIFLGSTLYNPCYVSITARCERFLTYPAQGSSTVAEYPLTVVVTPLA